MVVPADRIATPSHHHGMDWRGRNLIEDFYIEDLYYVCVLVCLRVYLLNRGYSTRRPAETVL